MNFMPIVYCMIFTMLLSLTACRQPDDSLYRLDQISMHHLQLFFDQEEAWANAVVQKDSINAASHLDSMQMVVLLFWETANFSHRTIPSEDSLYFTVKKDLWFWLSDLTDSVYPLVMQKAFLPKKLYTVAEEEQLMEIVSRNDSILRVRLDTLQLLRQDFSGLRDHL